MKYVVYTEKPKDFIATAEAAGLYLDCQGKILLLHRHPSRPQGTTWGVPAGKLELGEDPKTACLREVAEEVGVYLKEVIEVGALYISLPHVSYVYHMFYAACSERPVLTLSDEHVEARWVTPDEARALPLIKGGEEALTYYESFLARDTR